MLKPFLTLAALAALALPAHAITLVQWNFEATVAPAASTALTGIAPSTGTGTAGGLHAATTTWSTPAGNGSAKSLSANTWAVGDHWQFAFSTVGHTGVALSFDQGGSSTGPRDFALAYSNNGTSFTTFASYAVALSTFNVTSYSPVFTYTYDLSTIAALDNQATVVIRLINTSTVSIGGATVGTGGTNRVDNFTVIATPVPEPGTWALMLAGAAGIGFIARRRRA